MFDLKGKTALVTGSGQGIGRAIALLLAEQGARVVVNWCSNDAVAQQTLDGIEAVGGEYLKWKYDLSQPTVKEDWEAFCKENGVAVDILVLNASVQFRNAWENITFDEFDAQMHTNVRASLALIQACVPAMREKKWGRIVTIGSVQQSRPNTAMAVYAATKAAQNNLVMTLCGQLAGDGITINNIAPAMMRYDAHIGSHCSSHAAKAIAKNISPMTTIAVIANSVIISPNSWLVCSMLRTCSSWYCVFRYA